MQRLTCQKCKTKLLTKLPPGMVSKCPKCLGAIVVPGVEDNPFAFPSGQTVAIIDDSKIPYSVQQKRRAKRRRLMLYGSVIALALVASYYSFSGHGPLAPPPITCVGVADRINSRGVKFHWVECRAHQLPAIYLLPDEDWKKERLEGLGQTYLNAYLRGRTDGVVVVVQFPDAKEASEEAGAKRNSFAYGRFLIYGDAKLVKEIQNNL